MQTTAHVLLLAMADAGDPEEDDVVDLGDGKDPRYEPEFRRELRKRQRELISDMHSKL